MEVDQLFDAFTRGLKMTTEKGSKIPAEVQAQHIMRSAAEKLHGVIREFNPDSFGKVGIIALEVIVEALHSLAELLPDQDDSSEHLPVDLGSY